MKRKQLTLCAALIVALSIGGSVWAAENVATTSGSWTNTAIWDQGHIPNTTDDRAKVWALRTVTVDSVVAQAVSNIRLGQNLSNPGHLVIDPGASLVNNGLLQISGGLSTTVGSSLTVNGTYYNGGNMDVGHVSAAGTGGNLNINSGATVTAAGVINIGLGSTGTVTMAGGTVTQTGTGDTIVGSGFNHYGKLNMSGGSWTTGDDLIVGGENSRTGKATFSGGATMTVSDDLFLAGLNGRVNANGEVVVNDATLDVNDYLYVGRASSSTGTLTLDHADAQVNAYRLLVADNGGEGTVNLLDGELYVAGDTDFDNNVQIGAGGEVSFEKGVLEWNDATGTNELEQFWFDGDFTATKNDGNALSFTNNLSTITYSLDLGDDYTAWVGLNADGNSETFVTIPEPGALSLLILSSGLILWVRRCRLI